MMKKINPKTTTKLVEDKKGLLLSVILPFISVFGLTVLLFLAGSKFIKLSKKKSDVKKAIIVNPIKMPKDKMKEALEVINGIILDPVTLTKILNNNPSEIILMDLRSPDAFKKSHIKSSVNMSKEEAEKKYKDLRNKKVVIYGENSYDPIPKEVAAYLLGKRIDVRILAVGWNEFRHFRNLWLPESLWDKVDIDKYIVIQNNN